MENNKYITNAFIKANPELEIEVTNWVALLTRPDSDIILKELCALKSEKEKG